MRFYCCFSVFRCFGYPLFALLVMTLSTFAEIVEDGSVGLRLNAAGIDRKNILFIFLRDCVRRGE